MSKKISAALGSGVIIMCSFANPLWAGTCMSANGKIANNAQSGGATLGVAALSLDNKKYKCAISGVPQNPVPEGPNFRHTIVCDDKVGDGNPQSQITLNTFFTSPLVPTGACNEGNPFGPASFTFEEHSVPDPVTARGLFTGIDPSASSITITGDYNCAGGINMKFEGLMCFE